MGRMLRHDTRAVFVEGKSIGVDMKKFGKFVVAALMLCAGGAGASDEPMAGRHTIVGLLSMRHGEPARLFVNPVHAGRYILNIQNGASVAQMMKRKEYQGLVRVELQLFTPLENQAPAKILRISPAHVRRVPPVISHV